MLIPALNLSTLSSHQLDCKWSDELPKNHSRIECQLFKEKSISLSISYELLRRSSFWVSAETKIEGQSAIEYGHGSRVFPKAALLVSFAEAWERFIARQCAFAIKECGSIEGCLDGAKVELRTIKWAACTSSNGFAAGRTLREALHSAKAELFERYCMLKVWNREYGAVVLDVRVPFWGMPAVANGWRFSWFNLGEAEGLITIGCLAIHRDHGARFDSAGASKMRIGIEITFKSVLRMIYHFDRDPEEFHRAWANGEPSSHFIYYTEPTNLAAFEFLLNSKAKVAFKFPSFDAHQIPLWIAGEMPAVARAYSSELSDLYWGERALAACPNNTHPHPLS